MMENGKPRKSRQLSPEEKWEIFLEVTSQEISQADAARRWGVDVSTVIRIRQLARDACLAAFAAAKPGGRPPSTEQVELEAALAENDSATSPPTSTTAAALGAVVPVTPVGS
jgi:transposase